MAPKKHFQFVVKYSPSLHQFHHCSTAEHEAAMIYNEGNPAYDWEVVGETNNHADVEEIKSNHLADMEFAAAKKEKEAAKKK